MTTEPDLQCLNCLTDAQGVVFPLFPKSGNKFGEICAQCDEQSPWSRSPLVCADCEMELLSRKDVYGNRKWGEPRCEDCFVDFRYEVDHV